MSPAEVAFALQCSVGIVKQYVALIEEFGLDEQQVYDRVGAQTPSVPGTFTQLLPKGPDQMKDENRSQ